MSFGFLLPAGLAALGALLLPLLVHLVRRSEQRPTVFAALQWLQARSKPRRRLRIDEWPLLVTRLSLVALFALLLARPALFGSGESRAHVAVVPGVDLQQASAQQAAEDARWIWLAPGFPIFDRAANSVEPALPAAAATHGAASASITSLLRELDASLPADATLTVLAPEALSGVDAQRPLLSRRVDWRVLPGDMATAAPTAATDSTPALVVRFAPEHAASARYLRAADLAWRNAGAAYAPDVAPVSQPFDTQARHLAWLAPGPLPAPVVDWVRAGGTALVDARTSMEGIETTVPFWRDETGTVLIEGAALGRGRLLRFTRVLSPREIPQLLDPAFPEQVLRALAASPTPMPSRVRAADLEPAAGGPTFTAPPRELQPWLLVLIALVFLLERWLATAARPRVTP